jgi:hypothetical protein
MHALLVARADEVVGRAENSPEERELEALTDHHRSVRTPEVAAWPNSRRQRIAAVTNAHRACAVEFPDQALGMPNAVAALRQRLLLVGPRLVRQSRSRSAATLPTWRWWRGARGKSWQWRGSSRRRPAQFLARFHRRTTWQIAASPQQPTNGRRQSGGTRRGWPRPRRWPSPSPVRR